MRFIAPLRHFLGDQLLTNGTYTFPTPPTLSIRSTFPNGSSFYTLDVSGEKPLVKKKTVILKNDYIHHVVDIYHI